MKKPFFIMMYAQSGESAFPMVTENDDIYFWATEAEARQYADHHYFASRLGYEIFEMGAGE